ncbi:hypothetical protein M3201_04625 [Paenibacillus motobuensis]|uniref:hypothetical protein n=1 Tax=Paenibacillus TaxID=44249 RepID=UPI00203B38F4|nr:MULTISPECIES: hypothetical protein [Paenibacillus]MCM3038983.1 hypothetical protein [Paenibacillus lutimineralis]MCM3646087.1 hypothetical protein [Paenibacillus motobuensis]
MQIKIGIIGIQPVVDKLLKVLKAFPTFMPVVKIVQDEGEIPEAAELLMTEVEALILFGAQSHRKVKEKVNVTIPVHYVPLTGAGLYRTLFRAQHTGRLDGGISIDSLTKTMVMNALQDLGIEQAKIVLYNGPAHASADKLFAFHQQQLNAGACSLAITGVESVARRLSAAGAANEWLVPSDQDMSVTLERALLSTESRRMKESQIVVGMIKVDEFGKLVMKRGSEHEVQKLKLDIHRMVLDYVESLDGYLTPIGGDEYLFFTTRGIFERETGGYKTIPLAKDANQSFGISLSFGVGFGTSANEAGTNARAALRKSREAGGNTCFIIREDQTLIGPLEMSDPIQTVLSPTYSGLIKQAEEAGMTSAYLSKLLSYTAKFGKYEYTVHELAALLDITVRSAHRLLLLWIDNGLVDIAGMEKVPKGRPRQIYRFSFLKDKAMI